MSDLDLAAERGQRKRADGEARENTRRSGRPWPWKRRSAGARLAREALAAGPGYNYLGRLIAGPVGMGTFFLLDERVQIELVFALAVAAGTASWLLCLYINVRVRDARFTRELARLRALPFEADWDGYVRALQHGRLNTTVSLTARFANRLESAESKRIGDAALGLLDEGHASCTATTLNLRSPSMKTESWGMDNEGASNSNEAPHAWVKGSLEIVQKIHAEHPIARVEIRLQ